jgi:lipoprotein-anchoring transpeptidase ErfK/SrfK
VTIGGLSFGRLGRAAALAKLNRANGSPIRFTYAGAYWHVLPSKLGAHVQVAPAIANALDAAPGQTLPAPTMSVESLKLRDYVTSLARRWTHESKQAQVKLVGTHAVIDRKQSGVSVDKPRMTAEIESELRTGKRSQLQLAVKKERVSAVTQAKAVVVRLGSQRLTAYLDGKPILTTPVTTGRPALPTPIGSFKVQFRASPYVFHSPWPAGSAYYYPPTPVTWAMEFYDGDFLHDDPAEPSDAFGSDSQNGYFASHGCVHVPHDVMAFLYKWLPVGAPVIVAQN